MRVFVDSDVLIWYLRGDQRALSCLQELHHSPSCDMWTGAWQKVEIAFHARPREVPLTSRFLRLFKTAPMSGEIVDRAAELYRSFHPSHDTDVGDALLAASVIRAHGKLVTLNTKHFPMPELAVQRAWPRDGS